MDSIKIDNNQPFVVYCHTGHTASVSWLVLHEILENENAILYDSSTREWLSHSDLPVDQLMVIQH